MKFDWFDSRELDALADAVAAELQERVPPSSMPVLETKRARQLRKTLGTLFARIDAFAASRRLNLYQKAAFGNRIKWSMREAGYPETFVDDLTRELMLHAVIASRKGKKLASK